MGRGGLLAAALLLGACYDPDFSAVRYRCDGASPACPAGLRCIRGVCANPDEGRGCLSRQGRQVGGDVFACPGTFARGRARDLCAPDHEICAGGPVAQCPKRGFFATRAQAHRQADAALVCGAPPQDEPLLLLGCGAAGSDTIELGGACAGLGLALDCSATQRWTCGGGIDDAANQEDEESGVLCCRRP